MAVSSGFFNSIDGDRTYNADQMSTYFKGLISDGVYESVGSRLRVTNGNGMSVNVGTGRAVVLSRWVENDAELNLSIDAADVQYNRIDAIAVQLDLTDGGRFIDIIVKKGTNAADPEPPERSTTADVYELYLAYVNVPKGTSAITQDLITDLRPSELCGWITGLVEQVDTSDLYAQWAAAYAAYYAQSTAAFDAYIAQKQAEFETWFEHLTQQLNVDTTLHHYQNTVTVSGTTSSVVIGVEDYDADNDLLFAYSNGIMLVNGTDYTISGTGSTARILLANALTGVNDVTFVIIKPVIGEGGGGGTLIQKTITVNGVYTAADDGVYGYSSVTAEVPDAIKPSYLPNSYPANIIASNVPTINEIMPTSGRWYVPLSAADTDVTCYAVLWAPVDGGNLAILSIPYSNNNGCLPCFLIGSGATGQVTADVFNNNTVISGVYCNNWHVYTMSINTTTKKVKYYIDGVYIMEKTFVHSGNSVVLGAGSRSGTEYASRSISCRYVGVVNGLEDDATIIANHQYIMEHIDMT